MKKFLLFLFLLAIPALLLAEEPMREWKSISGKTIIEATFDVDNDSDPGMVYLRRNGKTYKVPFDKLSKADQEYVTRVRENYRNRSNNAGQEDVSRNEDSGLDIVPNANRYALLIGANEYAKPISSLPYSVQDMELLAESLQKTGMPKENIYLVTDNRPVDSRPTSAVIRRQIENITSLMKPEDQLIIVLSGHGGMVDGKSYYFPCDAYLKDEHSIISRDWVFDQLEKCKAKQKVLIMDTCRNDIDIDGGKDLQQLNLNDPDNAGSSGLVLIASCGKNQMSWDDKDIQHGVFTYFLAQGLTGEAKNKDGYVTVMSLFQYVSTQTKMYVYKQFNQVQIPTLRFGGEMTDFCLVKTADAPSASTPSEEPSDSSPAPNQETAPDQEAAPNQETAPDQEAAVSKNAGDRKTHTINGVEFAFRFCPAGTFMMGSSDSDEGRFSWEAQHQVTLTKGFWMLETEVTQKQWQAVMGNNPSHFKGDDLPVENVSWDDCQEFCRKCTELGLPLTLPTEAQWEYACRAGSTTPFFWGNALNGDKANCDGNYPFGTTSKGKNLMKTAPVGSYESNAWGLYDMVGNVYEWCQDWYEMYPSSSVTNPTGPSSGSDRVFRGGSWGNSARLCRSACRDNGNPGIRYASLGFRCIIAQ